MPRRLFTLASALFLLLFAAAHSLLTLLLLPHLSARGGPGPLAALLKAAAFCSTLPVLLPLMLFSPDGDRLPRWFQFASLPLNGVACGATLLLAAALIRRAVGARRRHRARRGLCPLCGYDLTGNTSGICPECGTPATTKGAT